MDTLTKHIYTFVSVIGVALAVTLAVVIGRRLSDEAISILAGAVCGVGASIPTSLLVVWVTRWWQREQRPGQPLPGVYSPPVVVQLPFQSDYLLPSVPPPTRGPIILDLDGEV